MADRPSRLRVVPYEPAHQAGFARLVVDVLGEFGFGFDPVLDADLLDPESCFDAAWVALDVGNVIGSVAIRQVADSDAELKRMYLLSPYRGIGHGRRLLEIALAWATNNGVRRVVLDTAEAMTAAQRLYEAAGFVRCGERTEIGATEYRCELLYSRDLSTANVRLTTLT